MENKRTSATYKWLSDEFTAVCCNGDSDHRADFVNGDDACKHWEGKPDA